MSYLNLNFLLKCLLKCYLRFLIINLYLFCSKFRKGFFTLGKYTVGTQHVNLFKMHYVPRLFKMNLFQISIVLLFCANLIVTSSEKIPNMWMLWSHQTFNQLQNSHRHYEWQGCNKLDGIYHFSPAGNNLVQEICIFTATSPTISTNCLILRSSSIIDAEL